MELFIYDGNRQLSGIVESYEYLRWTRRYSRCGSFELKAIAAPENVSLLKEGNIIHKSDDEEAGIIERVELSQTDREIITASGRFATSLLARRIIWGRVTANSDLGAAIGTLLSLNILSPTDISRKIAGLSYKQSSFGIPISTQISYKNLMEAVCDLCESADVGIKTVFNPAIGVFTVTPYRGGNSQAVFSKEYENLTEQTYVESADDYANTALVGGEGEGEARQFVTIAQGSGEHRREVFVDARDLQSADFPDNYTETLTFRGQSRLAELAPRYGFDAGVNPHGNLRYKTDFNLGDVVKVIAKPWGVSMTARITEIEETYDAEGLSLTVTFGKSELTLAQKMRSDMSGMKTSLLAASSGGGGGDGDIPDNSVTTEKLADNSVTSAKLTAGAVSTADIANYAVTTQKIADGQITHVKIGDYAVSTNNLADLSVTSLKMAAGAVTTAKMAQEADTSITITWGSGVSAAAANDSYVNKGVVVLGFQIQVTAGVAPGATILTITDANFRPYSTVRSVLVPVPSSTVTVPITIDAGGVMKNAASGTTLPVGYYMVSASYARA